MARNTEWIKSSEGQKLLKMDKGKFFYYAKAKSIRVKEGESERKSLYSLADIMRVKEELGIDDSPQTVIDWVKPSDVPATVALDFLVYQEAVIADINHYLSWVRKNPYISLAAFDTTDRRTALAYVAMLPLSESVIMKVLKGERSEMDIQADEIEEYNRPGAYTLLVESAVAHPEHPEQLGKVLRSLLTFWCEHYPERHIDKIYAQSVSPEGDILIQKLYFAARYDIAETAFMLDLRRPGASTFIRTFQQCLRAKEKQLQDKHE
ncbi:MAG: hypothetical protein JO202_00050 [Ktedonobacteraceae bacterium]|nr:hypothetical protein [Ktedonobacteraceae bacterium]